MLKLVRELQQSDAEVRRHEAAHAAAGGEFAGAPTFTYQTGPDGKRYAVGGEVSIDTSPVPMASFTTSPLTLMRTTSL